MKILLSETYTLSHQSDRMGFRLQGPKLTFQKREEMRSEATAFGCLQVPPSGQPIILMADRQTTGGYPIIGTIISVDLPKIAQAVPGSAIRFQKTTVDEAQAELKKREKWFQLLEKLHGGFL
jgi:allophanate hydrolase subunit 2